MVSDVPLPMLRRTTPSLLVATLVTLSLAGGAAWVVRSRAAPSLPAPQVVLLVDTATQVRLAPLLAQYAQDAAASLAPTYGGAAVRVVTEQVDLASYFPSGTIDALGQSRLTADVAELLERKYRSESLVGLVVVGRVPLPRVEEPLGPLLSLYPWVDFDAPAYVEDRASHRYVRSKEQDPQPEIWSGVLREPSGALPSVTLNGNVDGTPAVATLETYLTKNHLAHLGRLQYEHRVLLNDAWGEQQLREVKLADGRTPTATELPGGAELARRDAAGRFAQRLVSTGRYDGLNYADDGLVRQLPRDQGKTLAELLKKARDDGDSAAIARWRNGAGRLRQIDVASQVILYFDAWLQADVAALDQARAAAPGIVGARHPGFDLFARGGYDPCTETAPGGGTGYFSLSEDERSAVSISSGISDRAEFELALRWLKLYSDGEKRLHLIRDGVPPFGKYRSTTGTYDLRLTIAPGDDGYVVGGARLDGVCFTRGSGSNPATRGGTLEVLLGAATARENSTLPPGSLALWAVMTGLPQAAYGSTVPPSPDLALPEDLGSLSREEVAALAQRADTPGFGRSASVRGSGEGVGFDTDPFVLAAIAGQPFGEAVRATMDASSVLYGDPTFHL